MDVRKIVGKAYEAYSARDLHATLEAFSEDVVYDWPVDPATSAMSGRASGRAGMLQRFSALDATFDFLDFKVIEILTDGDRAASRVQLQLRSKETGAEFLVDAAHFWTFRDGFCCEFVEYFDSALVMAHAPAAPAA